MLSSASRTQLRVWDEVNGAPQRGHSRPTAWVKDSSDACPRAHNCAEPARLDGPVLDNP